MYQISLYIILSIPYFYRSKIFIILWVALGVIHEVEIVKKKKITCEE